jgi:hypothetical protein|tara:strand:+ start:605 stop:781 length:177 start_codon:yes stop_codon:yes gene_type:complete
MAKQSSTEVKLEFICREIKELKDEQKNLRADINRGKGALWILLIIAGMITGFMEWFNK